MQNTGVSHPIHTDTWAARRIVRGKHAPTWPHAAVRHQRLHVDTSLDCTPAWHTHTFHVEPELREGGTGG